MASQVEVDAAVVAGGDHRPRLGFNMGRHMCADRIDIAEKTRARPLRDQTKARMVAQHKAHLDLQILLFGLCHNLLPLDPVVASRLVVPHVLASGDDTFSLVEALVVTPLRRNGHNRIVAEHFLCAIENVDLPVDAIAFYLRAPLGVGLVEPGDLDIWIVEHRFELAAGVTVLSAVLRHANHVLLHRQREQQKQNTQIPAPAPRA